MKVKDQIRIRREALGMTMKELGDRVGVTEQAVRHWENGRSWPGKTKLRLVERALSCTIDFSEGVARSARTAMSMVDPMDHDLLVVIARMPKHAKEVFSEMARSQDPLIQSDSRRAVTAPRRDSMPTSC